MKIRAIRLEVVISPGLLNQVILCILLGGTVILHTKIVFHM